MTADLSHYRLWCLRRSRRCQLEAGVLGERVFRPVRADSSNLHLTLRRFVELLTVGGASRGSTAASTSPAKRECKSPVQRHIQEWPREFPV